jgi:hypothetical protein
VADIENTTDVAAGAAGEEPSVVIHIDLDDKMPSREEAIKDLGAKMDALISGYSHFVQKHKLGTSSLFT